MKKWFLIGLSISVMIMAAACGSSKPEDTSSNEEEISTGEVDEDFAEDDMTEAEVDENAPEHITLESISDTTSVPIYGTLWIDKKAIDFKCGEIKFPSQLYVEETVELHSDGESDFNEDDLMVKDYFQNNQKQYIFIEADGTLPGTRPTTNHTLIVNVDQKDQPYTKEELAETYEGFTVTEITVDGVSGFALRPDTAKSDSGFASVLFFLNAGSYEHAYGTSYFYMEINYQGGLADYTEVDFDEITEALLELITVDFKLTE